MSKRYSDCHDEISSDELYEGLLAHGMFTEKLPPVFTSRSFYRYAEKQKQPFSSKKGGWGYVFFESMRDTNVPRALGIPNPIAYQRLCASLRDNWREIQRHFYSHTNGDKYKISRIHIRKRKGEKSLFKMNYSDWRVDDSPVPDILVGKRYVVTADISTCFPSIYTHSLCWAVVGKDEAKNNRDSTLWYNELDHRCMDLKSCETHGLLIGPHASNLLAEIILTVIDDHLSKKWEYIRNIDDYTCYVKSNVEGQLFLTELAAQLRNFDLSLNHKKTKIKELPIASTKHWVRQLNAFDFSASHGSVDYKKAQAYLDVAVSLMSENDDNAAILNYAIKVLAKEKLSDRAKDYCAKTILHMAVIYPYLIPMLEDYVFKPLEVSDETVMEFAKIVYNDALERENYEAIIYMIYYALKYNFKLLAVKDEYAIKKDSCLFKLFAYLYFERQKNKEARDELKRHAKELSKNDFDCNWLFIYEVLSCDDLDGEWKALKKEGVSFIKALFRSSVSKRGGVAGELPR